MPRVIFKGLVIAVGSLILLLVAAVLYLTFADLSGYRSYVERGVARATGRELTIAGKFEPHVSGTVRIVAEDVTLANVDWSDRPAMVHVDHLELSVDPWSLLFGPVRLSQVKIHGGSVLIEKDADGQHNWTFDTLEREPATRKSPDAGIGVTFGEVELREVELVYDEPGLEQAFVLRAGSLDAHPAGGELMDLRFDGILAHTPLELSGSSSPIEQLIVGRNVTADVSGRYGDADFTLRGSMARLAGLEGPELSFELRGPDSNSVTGPLGLPSLGSETFSVSARTRLSGDAVDLDAEIALELLRVDAHGSLDSLLAPEMLDLTVNASGTDLAAAGAWIGVRDLPDEAFSVFGRVRRDGTRTHFEHVEASVGENVVRLDGVLGAYPTMVDTDFRLDATGPDVSALGALLDLELPAEPFEIRGRVVRQQAGIEVVDLRARIGASSLRVDGRIGDPPGFVATALELSADGPDLSNFSDLAGVDLPADHFELTGHVEHDETGIRLDSVSARVGESTLRVEGVVVPEPGLGGSDLYVDASGPDLSRLGEVLGNAELPAASFHVSGRVRPSDHHYRLDGVMAHVDDLAVGLDGVLGPVPGLAGTAVRVTAAGPDLSRLGDLVGRHDLPAEPFRLSGHARVLEDGYDLERVEATIGGIEVAANGHVGLLPEIDGTNLELDIRVERLSALNAFLEEPPLPAEPFRVSGRVRVEPAGYTLTDVAGELGGNRFSIDGFLGPLPGFEATDVAVGLAGPDLSALGRMVVDAGLAELPDLRDGPFDVAGRVRIDSQGYRIDNATARVGENEARLSGRVGLPPRFVGSDITIEGHGPDVTRIAPLADSGLPAEPFRVAGRVERQEKGLAFHGVRVTLGDYHTDVDGYLGEPPRLLGSLLDVRVEGPDPNLLSRYLDLPSLPPAPFAVSGHLEGTPEEITLDGLRARFGPSDLSGSLRLDMRGKPDFKGEFVSNLVDLGMLDVGSQTEPDATSGTTAPTDTGEDEETSDSGEDETKGHRKRELLISDDPLSFEVLQGANVDLRWTINELRSPRKGEAGTLDFKLSLIDGRLLVGPVEMHTNVGATIWGRILVEPEGPRYRLLVDLRTKRLRPDLISYGDDRSQWAPVDLELSLAGAGDSPHAVAGSADGRLTIVVGEGKIENSALNLLAADQLLKILRTLNPFHKEERYTSLECGVLHVELADGKAVAEELAVRTDKMTIVGGGKIDFATEKLDLQWAAKPREGVGISASAITNPYIKLGGTLSDPALEIKPLEAVTSTGVAVATLGISILARGLYDRVSAERQVCTRALKRIEKKAGERDRLP